jgi:hypothetical protein
MSRPLHGDSPQGRARRAGGWHRGMMLSTVLPAVLLLVLLTLSSRHSGQTSSKDRLQRVSERQHAGEASSAAGSAGAASDHLCTAHHLTRFGMAMVFRCFQAAHLSSVSTHRTSVPPGAAAWRARWCCARPAGQRLVKQGAAVPLHRHTQRQRCPVWLRAAAAPFGLLSLDPCCCQGTCMRPCIYVHMQPM